MKYLWILAFAILFGCTTTRYAYPVASLPDVAYSFDQLPAVFEFSISPWQGEEKHIIDGRVIDNNGSNVSGIDMKAVETLAGSGISQAVLGKDKWFRGTVKTALSPGEYTVQVDHILWGEQDSKTMKLVVFKTGLTPESEKTLRNGLGYLAFFGKKMAVTNAVPTSGLKIKPEQFRTYIYTDLEQEKPPFNGYTIANENGVFLDCQAKNVTLKITWIQPFTNQEIPLFPETKLDIRQEKPRINTMDKQDNIIQSGNRVKVTARGIRIGKPSDGKDQTSTADVEVKTGKATLETRLQGLVDIATEPTIEKDGDLYNVSFDLSVNLPKGTDMINGMVKVPIRAQATNKCAGLQSDWEEKIVSVSFKYEQEKIGRGARQPAVVTKPGGLYAYRLNDISQIQSAFTETNKKPDEQIQLISIDTLRATVDKVIFEIIERSVMSGASFDDTRTELINSGMALPENRIFISIYEYFKKIYGSTDSMFFITKNNLEYPANSDFLFLIVSNNHCTFLDAVARIGKNDSVKLYSADVLKTMKLNMSYNSDNFYDMILEQIKAGKYTLDQ